MNAIIRFFHNAIFVPLMLLIFVSDAYAYLGPGAGLGLIGSLLGGVLVVLVIVFGLILYPIRRFMKRKSVKTQAEENGGSIA